MTTNDTRTQKDRDYLNLASDWAYVAEKAGLAPDATADEIVAGFLSRDAEPTTVTAEQIEKAAAQIALFDDYELRQINGLLRFSYLRAATAAFRAAGFRIEGDEA